MENQAPPAVGDTAEAGTLKTEYSPNARSKCQLCRMKICKGSWRMQLAVYDPYHPHSDGRARFAWESSHASCYFENVSHPVDLRNSTQSMPYYGTPPNIEWSNAPTIVYPANEEGELMNAVLAALSSADTLSQSLPSPALRACHSNAVAKVVSGADALNENDRTVLELFCLHKKLTDESKSLLKISEAADAELPQPDDSGDPLKSKFTQYSPNSMAHCRDCQKRLEEGTVRVGAHVFSSSSRHAGFSINYWCLECICARPALRRLARMYPTEIEKILPGAELLSAVDLQHACALLDIAVPDPTALTALAAGRVRATRSGRKFNTWGGTPDEGNAAHAVVVDVNDDVNDDAAAANAVVNPPRSKRARI
mmetsp:Transcript_1918/g.4169  ORF Transcript_1918/g.4169 Transcript_1918/m.4169 type:complete len:367 (+) Transcript_1918:57-1157(+)|eukprot:CAMPEP_0170372264 /NCGR_PEP_ID=MMETSP0117_2-20130122/9462_1 /TAXON_ID=400756 /ORGANISM="Durinskia baltica, Strain CSIRO CS-38" /LENGTH=366 /DNA_ID=CAMNT_0010627115 /DNA_START=56 /DNA_END=1156 /DNA_ORIENTATION=+